MFSRLVSTLGASSSFLYSLRERFYFEQVIYEANLRLKKMSGGRYALKRRAEAENKRSVTEKFASLGLLDYEIKDKRDIRRKRQDKVLALYSIRLELSKFQQNNK